MSWHQYAQMAACHHEPTKIFEHDGVKYYGSDERGAQEFEDGLILNLSGKPRFHASFNIPELKAHYDINYDEIMVPWPDFGIPAVKNSFWQAIHSYVLKKKYKNVCIHCVGGHGRTGTALSALLIVNKQMTVTDAITRVRTQHCNDAVESDAQIRYLQQLDLEINGRPIKSLRLKGSMHTIERRLRR